MATLRHTTIMQKGNSQPVRKFGCIPNELYLNSIYNSTEERDFRLSFTTSASGVSYTDYRILIGVDDYAAIIKAMCDVNADVALSAMACEVAEHLFKVLSDDIVSLRRSQQTGWVIRGEDVET